MDTKKFVKDFIKGAVIGMAVRNGIKLGKMIRVEAAWYKELEKIDLLCADGHLHRVCFVDSAHNGNMFVGKIGSVIAGCTELWYKPGVFLVCTDHLFDSFDEGIKDFFKYHELGHIYYGDIGLKKLTPKAVMASIGKNPVETQAAARKLEIEVRADKFAADHTGPITAIRALEMILDITNEYLEQTKERNITWAIPINEQAVAEVAARLAAMRELAVA